MENQLLWKTFKKNNSVDLKKKLILQYQNLVHYVIHHSRFYGAGILDERDCFSFGVEGLCEAIDRFNPNYGTKFETYAISRIRGKIIDELRKTEIKPKVFALDENQNEIHYSKISLEYSNDEESGMLYETLSNDEDLPDDISEKNEAQEILVEALKTLEDRERMIISLIYFENLSLRDVAELMKISVPRVSQIRTKIIEKLKKKVLVNYN